LIWQYTKYGIPNDGDKTEGKYAYPFGRSGASTYKIVGYDPVLEQSK
jgi:hypothetical protein